ncbi:MAG: hypothetical protein NXY57DRAFT_1042388 [Lentinula lateritia]|nr:MAG: hypothetical protein NXY57DRAFT_1042388 [Lentinula lateritia]
MVEAGEGQESEDLSLDLESKVSNRSPLSFPQLMPPGVERLTRKSLKRPATITIGEGDLVVDTVDLFGKRERKCVERTGFHATWYDVEHSHCDQRVIRFGILEDVDEPVLENIDGPGKMRSKRRKFTDMQTSIYAPSLHFWPRIFTSFHPYKVTDCNEIEESARRAVDITTFQTFHELVQQSNTAGSVVCIRALRTERNERQFFSEFPNDVSSVLSRSMCSCRVALRLGSWFDTSGTYMSLLRLARRGPLASPFPSQVARQDLHTSAIIRLQNSHDEVAGFRYSAKRRTNAQITFTCTVRRTADDEAWNEPNPTPWCDNNL